VDYYLENDIKKAEYMQRKQNALTVKAININSVENRPPSKVNFERKMREEVEKINDYESTYLTSLVNQSQKSQKRIKECVLADLTRQEQQFQDRMLKRIRSAGKL
jgi:hypothetical protein